MVERRIKDEHILVPVGDNLYELDSLFALNEVASFIWTRAADEVPREEILQGIVARYEVTSEEAVADMDRILSELVEIGALETRERSD